MRKSMETKTMNQLLSENKKKFLIISNYVIIITVVLDLMHLTNILTFPLQQFALFNMIILVVALRNYNIKREINEKLKAIRKNDKEEN